MSIGSTCVVRAPALQADDFVDDWLDATGVVAEWQVKWETWILLTRVLIRDGACCTDSNVEQTETTDTDRLELAQRSSNIGVDGTEVKSLQVGFELRSLPSGRQVQSGCNPTVIPACFSIESPRIEETTKAASLVQNHVWYTISTSFLGFGTNGACLDGFNQAYSE